MQDVQLKVTLTEASYDTVLTRLTGGETATVTVAGHTQINGALVATVDETGQDKGKLTLDTGTLDFSDLKNTRYGQNSALGVNTGVSVGKAPDSDTVKIDATSNRSGLQYQNSSTAWAKPSPLWVKARSRWAVTVRVRQRSTGM